MQVSCGLLSDPLIQLVFWKPYDVCIISLLNEPFSLNVGAHLDFWNVPLPHSKNMFGYRQTLTVLCSLGLGLITLLITFLLHSRVKLRLFSHDGKVRILNFNSKCAFWIKIRKTHFRPCVCQITSRNVIWNAHLKSRYRRVFQLRFSQITQRNLCMNDLTSKSCFGGRS